MGARSCTAVSCSLSQPRHSGVLCVTWVKLLVVGFSVHAHESEAPSQARSRDDAAKLPARHGAPSPGMVTPGKVDPKWRRPTRSCSGSRRASRPSCLNSHAVNEVAESGPSARGRSGDSPVDSARALAGTLTVGSRSSTLRLLRAQAVVRPVGAARVATGMASRQDLHFRAGRRRGFGFDDCTDDDFSFGRLPSRLKKASRRASRFAVVSPGRRRRFISATAHRSMNVDLTVGASACSAARDW